MTFEQLEAKTPLAVDVSLTDAMLTLTYGADTDAAVLTIDDDGNYAVTGLNGTVITGAASSGNFFDDVMAVSVVNSSGGEGQSFTFTSTIQIGLLESTASGFALAIGSESAPIATVSISSPEFIGFNGPAAIYADDVSIDGSVFGPGESLVIQATGLVDIDEIDEFGGSITITSQSFTMSGSLLNDGFSESGPIPGSGGLTAGTGYSITIDASETISIAGAVSSNGGGMLATSSGAGFARAGAGGAIVLMAGGSISVPGGISAAGGSVTAAGSAAAGTATAGAGGTITLQAGGAISVGGLSVAGGSTQAGSGTTASGGAGGAISLMAASGITVAGSTDAAGGTGQTTSGAGGSVEMAIGAASAAVSVRSSTGSPARGVSPAVRTRDIVGGDIRLEAGTGLIVLTGNITASGGDVSFVGPVRLERPVRIDTASGGGDVTFTSTLDGRRPLAIAAGTGAVVFGGIVGATRPLAGLRLETAGAVTSNARVNVAGGTPDAFRHGIELFPDVTNVRLTHGGTIRNFTSGQAIHVAMGSAGSVISGFRITNSGRPFVGWGGIGQALMLSNNVVAIPVPRAASARITSGGDRTDDPRPVISGTARSGDQIVLYANGIPVGSTTADGSTWSIVPTRLNGGRSVLSVRSLGPDGVASDASRPVALAR